MKIQLIERKNLTPAVWDGGKTFEYYLSPIDAKYSERNFDFRISSATIEKTPSNFTQFDHFHRYLVMLDNELKINRNELNESYQRATLFEFPSSDKIVSFSLGNDFNWMVKNEWKTRTKLEVRRLDTFSVNAAFLFVFAFEKTVVTSSEGKWILEEKDLLVIENPKKEMKLNSDKTVILGQIHKS